MNTTSDKICGHTCGCTSAEECHSGSVPEKSDNELIAEFMMWERDDKNCPVEYTSWYKHGRLPIPYSYLSQYSKSWDWLMPVVEKIRKVILPELHKAMPPHSTTKGDMIDVDIACGFMEVSIEIVYKNVVEFIKWYNQQQHEQ